MKIGFICPTVPGRLNAMTALAPHLQARKDEVVFLYSSSANGLPDVSGDKEDDLNASRREISKLEGDGAIRHLSSRVVKDQLVSLERSGRLKSLDKLDYVHHLSLKGSSIIELNRRLARCDRRQAIACRSGMQQVARPPVQRSSTRRTTVLLR